MAERDTSDIQVIVRCAQILRQLEPGVRLRVGPLAKELGIGRSTLHRYLNSMSSADLIERVGDGEYAPGPLLAQLGTMALSSLQVVEIAGVAMRQLCQQVGETVVLSVWGGLAPVVTRVELPDQLIQVMVRVGSPLPINAAQTRVFLAFLDEPRTVERLLSLVPERRAEIDEDIERARSEGLLVYSGSVVGLSTVAVPVFNSRGIAATLAVIGTDPSVLSQDRTDLGTELRAVARSLSEQLGFDGQYPGAEPAAIA
ncbi:IclR family transcriptional regulator [Ornithinimicrobium cavernae]|uniref:IclR family transcriptional regulator n=1 Tax=Ornithinimicrobium cavernae TaxID=2666047 RepID=UPI000D69C061|nr:IclR family transcriptional regulator [Ornithinimicrobium cavernae]